MAYVILRGDHGGSASTVSIGPLTDLKALDIFGSVHDHFTTKGGVTVWVGETEAIWVPSTWLLRLELDRPIEGRRDDDSQLHGTLR